MARRQFWQLPALHREEEHAKHRPVTWIELFLDLFVVVAVAQLAHPLHDATGARDLGMFVAQFGLLLWVWVGLTYYQERFETEGLENRVILFAFMLGISGMAAFAHDGLGHNWRGFVGSYCATRVFTVLLWARAGWHVPEFRGVAARYCMLFGLGQGTAFASLFAPVEQRPYMIGVAIVLEVVTPLTILGENRKLPRVSSSKHPERFGLFALIVLGEAVAGIVTGLGDQHAVGGDELVRAALSLLVGFGMWWVYFDFVGRRPFKPSPLPMYVWVYLHFALYAIIVIAGIAMSEIVRGHPHAFVTELGGLAIGAFLLVCGVFETVLLRKHDEPTHPVRSPALKIASAPVAAVAGYVATGATQLAWMFGALLVQMIYGLYVWFTQELDEHAGEHAH
jgi:low temperature requirement protein LtrA